MLKNIHVDEHHYDPTGIQLKYHFFTYLLTYLLTPFSRVLLEKLTGSQLVKKLSAFYGTRRSITAFTSVRSLSYSSEAFVSGSFHDTFLRRGAISTTPNSPSWRNTPCRKFVTAYSVRSQLPSKLEVFPPSAT